MKRIAFVLVYLFPVCLMLLATGNVNAQVASTKGWFYGVPKTLTSSGKPVLFSIEGNHDNDNETIIIYDEDIQVAKRIEIAPFHYESKSWDEYAKVMPTGAEIVSSTVTESNVMSIIGIDLAKVTSVDEVNTLLESTEYYDGYSDNTIQMQLDDNEKGQDVMLSDMAGQVLDKSHIPAGQHSAQMNASHLRHGIYNVTLMQNGKVHQSQKIRIK